MLVYSETRYIPTDFNVMVLQDNLENYIYCHRILYDSAVILADHYNNDYEKLAADISPTGDIPADRDDVKVFYDNAPDPIRMLAPFLLLCQGKFTSLYDMAGAIHVMSNTFNFRKLPDIPKEVRLNAMTFSMLITEEYQLSWELFLSKCIPYSSDLLLQKTVSPMSYAPSSPSTPFAPQETSTPAEPENVTWLTLPDGSKIALDDDDTSVFDSISDDLGIDNVGEDNDEEEEVAPPAPPTSSSSSKPKATGLDFLKTLK